MNKRADQMSVENAENGGIMQNKELNKENKQQTAQWRFAALLLSGVVIILGSVLFALFWQMHGQQAPRGNTTLAPRETPTSIVAPGSSQINGIPSAWPAQYKDTTKQGIAEQLNLSIAQIKEKLSQPQVSLFEVTTEQGFQPNQVLPLWLNVLQSAGNLMIKVGTWTPPQAENYWHYWSNQQQSALGQKNMDAELSRWFTES